jgi:hypothetical protein
MNGTVVPSCSIPCSETVAEAERQVRTIYIGRFVGQLVSGAIWLVSAALTTWMSQRAGVLVLVFGGMLTFPLTQMILRIRERSASLPPDNPLRELAVEITFLVPLLLPLVGAATLRNSAWFYLAMMIVGGAHYLPFSFPYGMRQFIVLAGLLLIPGLLIGLYARSMGTWGLVRGHSSRRVRIRRPSRRTADRIPPVVPASGSLPR